MEDSEIGITRANLSLDRTSGDFTIATETETYYQSYSTDSEIEKATVSGNFKRDDNGNFTLDINDISSEADEDDYYSSDYKYTFSISAAQGADITAPASYKELDDWTDEDIEKMSSGIQEFVLRAYLGDSYDDYASMY